MSAAEEVPTAKVDDPYKPVGKGRGGGGRLTGKTSASSHLANRKPITSTAPFSHHHGGNRGPDENFVVAKKQSKPAEQDYPPADREIDQAFAPLTEAEKRAFRGSTNKR